MRTILLVNGPNLNLLGRREPEIYGKTTLAEIVEQMTARGRDLGIVIKSLQSNHEGALIDFIQAEYESADGVIINPGALTHYGYSLRDCLAGISRPIIEVHISNLQKREEWRRRSVITELCIGQISGLGVKGYFLALDYFAAV